jgi:probable F420-dependent oxidoreductase
MPAVRGPRSARRDGPGARPEDRAIEQPTEVELVINRKTDTGPGLALPWTRRLRGDAVHRAFAASSFLDTLATSALWSRSPPQEAPTPMPMKFSVNLVSQHAADRAQRDLYAEMLEQAEAAEAFGFDAIFLNEHHPYETAGQLWLQPLPALAGLATRTRRIGLGTNILILPLYHPIRLAEDVGMIHAMSGGRVILGVAIGYKTEEFEALGVPLRTRVGRFVEQIEILRSLWTRTKVSHAGRHFAFTDVSLPIQTLPSPPPIWIGAEVQPAIVRAARLGDAWLPADTSSVALLGQDYRVYREALVAAGKRLETIERPLMRETFVLPDPDEASALLAPTVLEKYREYWRMGAPQLRAEFPRDDFGFEALRHDRFVVGGPEDAIGQIQRHVRALDLTHLIFRIQKKGIAHRDVLRVLRTLGEQVIPHCR